MAVLLRCTVCIYVAQKVVVLISISEQVCFNLRKKAKDSFDSLTVDKPRVFEVLREC